MTPPLRMPEPLPASAFTAISPNRFAASALTRGPWNDGHQHAGPPTALVCRAIERVAAESGLTHVARLTVNLLRPVLIGEIEIDVQTDYAGRNAGHYSARLMSGGKEAARFTALVQRESAVTLPEPAHVLPPLAPDRAAAASPEGRMPFSSTDRVGYGTLVETRVARGRLFDGPCQVWFRLRHPLLEGETPSPFQRVLVAADSGNGISAMLDFRRFSFVNSDLTVNLLRRPLGEWTCLDARTHLGTQGGGVVETKLFDEAGFIGLATQSLMVRPRE